MTYPPRTNPVVEIDEDDILAGFLYYCGAVVICIWVLDITSALDINPNRKVRVNSSRSRPPNVNKKAILGLSWRRKFDASTETNRLELLNHQQDVRSDIYNILLWHFAGQWFSAALLELWISNRQLVEQQTASLDIDWHLSSAFCLGIESSQGQQLADPETHNLALASH